MIVKKNKRIKNNDGTDHPLQRINKNDIIYTRISAQEVSRHRRVNPRNMLLYYTIIGTGF